MKQAAKIINEVRKVVIGKDEILIKVMEVILAGGNILIEDTPEWEKPQWHSLFLKQCS